MKIIYFLSFLFFTNAAFAQNKPSLRVQATYYIDSNSTLNLQQVEKQKFTAFKNNSINIGYNDNAAVWCRFKITNTNPKQLQKTWLCFDNNHLDSIIMYGNGLSQTLGDRTKYTSPFMVTQAFELALKPNQTKVVYVKVKKLYSFLDFDYRFSTSKKLIKQSNSKIGIISFFLGMVLLLILFNSVLYIITHQKMYVFYILNAIISIVYVLTSSYYFKCLIFTEFLYFSEIRIYSVALWSISLNTFISCFLNLKNTQPNNYKIIIGLNFFILFLIIITIVLLICEDYNTIKIFFTLGYLLFASNVSIIFIVALRQLKIDKKAAMYILLSFSPQLIWAIIHFLKTYKVIHDNLFQDWLVFFCLYEVFLFGYVLTQNYIATFIKNNQLNNAVIVEKENTLQTITQTQIRERRNIANILHDDLGSKIAHIGQLLQLNNHLLANQSINQLADDIREISHQILPKALDDGALIASLHSQIHSLNDGLKAINITLNGYDFPEKVIQPWVYDMYLISIEIINNALKHGQATAIQIEFYQYAKHFTFQYSDNGLGFKVAQTPKGFGLDNIEKRVLYYKGIIEINSQPNQGTVVQINLPIK